jgi:Rps23 Pro-64 3,4-dihydroxylase Tpa1-like proline 4-hydroxylase
VVQTLPGRQELQELAERLAPAFASAQPFPHVVVDDILAKDTARQIIDDFPQPDPRWQHFDDPNQLKFALRDEEAMPPSIRAVIQHFNSQVFVEFLETLTGIRGLIPDPHLLGGGLHQIPPGGTLKVHADFNKHRILQADRRLNVLLYLNEDWLEEYGGYLELWDRAMTAPVVRVAPVANRMVVFETSSDSYHGHPDVLAVPEGRYRRSLAWYYYTTPTAEGGPAHNTLWAAGQGNGLAGVRKKIRGLVPARSGGPTATPRSNFISLFDAAIR